MSAVLPPKLRVVLGPAQFSGPVVGPHDPYLRDCWTAALGPGQVLCYRRLHQFVGSEVPTAALARSLGMGTTPELPRLARCLSRLAEFGALRVEGDTCRLAPGLRYLTRGELRRAGPIVQGLHAVHLRRQGLEPPRIAALAAEGARGLRREPGLAMGMVAS